MHVEQIQTQMLVLKEMKLEMPDLLGMMKTHTTQKQLTKELLWT